VDLGTVLSLTPIRLEQLRGQAEAADSLMHWAECLARVDTRFAETTGADLVLL
jgi:hypothetical protein